MLCFPAKTELYDSVQFHWVTANRLRISFAAFEPSWVHVESQASREKWGKMNFYVELLMDLAKTQGLVWTFRLEFISYIYLIVCMCKKRFANYPKEDHKVINI